MKLFAIILLAILPVVDAVQDASSKVEIALNEGNAEVLGKLMMPSVDLTILDDEDSYAKDDVVTKLKKFFSENKVVSFKIKHKGTSKLNDHYRIGTLATNNGEFRVTYFMSDQGNGMLIKQFRIE